MERFLQFELGCHKLPIATGRRGRVVRASRQCRFAAIPNASHCPRPQQNLRVCISAALRAKYADLLTATTDTMRYFCAGGSPEGLWLCPRLLEFHQRIEFATVAGWHMRSDLLAG